MRLPACICFSLLLFSLDGRGDEVEKAPPEFKSLHYRMIGPFAGGRVSRAVGVPGDPLTYYFAAAASGVWKSENGGISFRPIFDDQPISSIGSIAVAPSDPNVVYVGSGEANIRGNVAAGNGIYKSMDAGKTWKHVWKTVGQIGTMIVHPTDPNVAFAAVLGHAFGPNEERGVYRTRDGGKTWERVLSKDRDTGASDVCFDPNNPRVLFAGLWAARRKPWEMTSGGPTCGLYHSRDGGDTWELLGPLDEKQKEKLDKPRGLPKGPYGKIAVAVAPSDSRRVYALIEAEKGGLYRSDDAGETWELAGDDPLLRQRIWYFGTITVDPKNADTVWAPQVPLLKSIDAGKSFKSVRGPHHGDFHDAWIDPLNPKRMIVANDGGVDISTDGGRNWYAPPLPISQFYHIACDNAVPYRVMGNMQDLGTASGPSNSLNGAGILLGDWTNVGGGETGFSIPDPTDPNVVYSGEYGGFISRHDRRTRQSRSVSAYPFDPSGFGAEALKYRFQWTAPILVSQHDSRVVYHGANVLFRTRDGGQTWEKASPDLTRNDRGKQKWSGGPITGDNTGVETYCTIFALAESPKNSEVLWTGSDDGLVHVTRDGGKKWDNVTASIPDFPDWGTVQCVEPSRHDEGTAYLVAEAHRLDDDRPYVWKTTNFGKTWTKLGDTLPQNEYAHVLREDPKRKGLLYLGTERKVWFSFDDGKSWQPLRLNMPTVAVHDLVVKGNDLVVGTNGRSIWILDDLTAIREWQPKVASQPVHLFPISDAVRWRFGSTVTAHQRRVKGDNPPPGATVQFFLKEEPKTPIKLEFLNPEGKKVIDFVSKKKDEKDKPEEEEDDEPKKANVSAKAGVNRFVWDLLHPGATTIPKARVDAGDPTVGTMVSPGTYRVNLTVDGKVYSNTFEVVMDPRVALRGAEREKLPMPKDLAPSQKSEPVLLTKEDLIEQEKFALSLRQQITDLSNAVIQIRSLQKQIKLHEELFKHDPKGKELLQVEKGFLKKLDALEEKLHNPKARIDYDILAQKGGAKLYSQLTWVVEQLRDADGPPTQGIRELARELEKEHRRLLGDWETLRKIDLSKVNDAAKKINAPTLWVPEPKTP
jgi:photosystem II stability/assembly factor-like uncharacterized protein